MDSDMDGGGEAEGRGDGDASAAAAAAAALLDEWEAAWEREPLLRGDSVAWLCRPCDCACALAPLPLLRLLPPFFSEA